MNQTTLYQANKLDGEARKYRELANKVCNIHMGYDFNEVWKEFSAIASSEGKKAILKIIEHSFTAQAEKKQDELNQL